MIDSFVDPIYPLHYFILDERKRCVILSEYQLLRMFEEFDTSNSRDFGQEALCDSLLRRLRIRITMVGVLEEIGLESVLQDPSFPQWLAEFQLIPNHLPWAPDKPKRAKFLGIFG